ncbi:MAG: N-acetylmuramic acid 6-phosphate etherase [Tannerella sp.]|nr:N-acetylmuramic acid 6-phosphate etherase [Tannerella sp.]
MAFERITEASSLYDNLEQKTTRELLEEMNAENRKVTEAVEKVIPRVEELVHRIEGLMRQGGRLFYLGAGTSGRLGVLDASEIPPTFGTAPGCVVGLIAGGDAALRLPVEHAEDDAAQGWKDLQAYHAGEKDTLIGIAASGTTPYVVGALQAARKQGILTAAITGNPDSPLAAAADIAIEVIVGPEYVTGSSRLKSGTAQKLILNMISTSVMIRLGRIKGNRMVHMQLTSQKLVDRGARMLVEALPVSREQAHTLLLMYGSVKTAMEAFNAPEQQGVQVGK